MSQTELGLKLMNKLAQRIRELSDQEIVAIYNDAVAWRAFRHQSISNLAQSALIEVQEEANKEKKKKKKNS